MRFKNSPKIKKRRMTMINKEMNTTDLAIVTGGGWKTNLAIGGLCLASGPIGTMICLGAYNGYMDSAR